MPWIVYLSDLVIGVIVDAALLMRCILVPFHGPFDGRFPIGDVFISFGWNVFDGDLTHW